MKISSKYITQILKDDFAIVAVKVELIRNLPIRNTYLINDGEHMYISKVFRKEKQEGDIKQSLAIQSHLIQCNFQLPKLKANLKGFYLSDVGDFILTCQEYISGITLGLNDQDIEDLAFYLRELRQIKYNGQNIVHGDFLLNNAIRRVNDRKVFLVDWDYSHLGASNEDSEYFLNEEILSSRLPKKVIEHLKSLFITNLESN